MSRIAHILGLSFEDGVLGSVGLLGAYCFCLTPSEACNLLEQGLEARVDLRDTVLKKVCADLDNSYTDCHARLLKELLVRFSTVDSRGRQSFGYCLTAIVNHVPLAERRTIQEFFLASKYVGVRKRGYKSISADADIPQKLLLDAWERFSDSECAWLIVKTFPVDFLIQHRHSLLAVFSEGWQVARLYLRIGQRNPRLLEELKAMDQISYCYVLAKLDGRLSLKDAITMIDGNSRDERFGLLVWSLGRLRLWKALQYVESKLPAIQEQKLADMRARYGINRFQPTPPLRRGAAEPAR